VPICERVEKVENIRSVEDPLYAGAWERVNRHIGTTARCIPELVEQLGIARYGHRPVVGDPFCGGGSIPFESARIGCDVVASDLNPVAAMLTWSAVNIIGADAATRHRISADQKRVAEMVDDEITRLGIEHNAYGDRAKAYLYCLETVDPQTGWLVPMAPSWVISRNRRCIARLVPDYLRKRFDIVIEQNVSTAELAESERGTVSDDGYLTYWLAPIQDGVVKEWRIPIVRLRGDGQGPAEPDGTRGNLLRRWEISDISPRLPQWVPDATPVVLGCPSGAWVGGDIWQERLYCIQWMDAEDLRRGKYRPATRFAAPDDADIAREAQVAALVRDNLADWQARGLVPDMAIEPGDETTRLGRERGWSYWHHLFAPRHLLLLSRVRSHSTQPSLALRLCSLLNRTSRLTQWHLGHGGRDGSAPSADQVDHVFYNQALNVAFNFASRSWPALTPFLLDEFPTFPTGAGAHVRSIGAVESKTKADLWMYDPPYADAVRYPRSLNFSSHGCARSHRRRFSSGIGTAVGR
jgi:putative DNA methylase